MSRVANNPVTVPSGVEVKLDGKGGESGTGVGGVSFDVHSLPSLPSEIGADVFSRSAPPLVARWTAFMTS